MQRRIAMPAKAASMDRKVERTLTNKAARRVVKMTWWGLVKSMVREALL